MTSISLPFGAVGGIARHGGRSQAALPAGWWADLAAIVALLGVGVLAFGPVFDGGPGLRAAGGGAVVGTVVAVVSAWRRWSSLGTAAVVFAAYFVFGGVCAIPTTTIGGLLPSAATIGRLALLSVDAWRDLLTVSTPASAFTGPAVVPYLTGLLAAVLAVSAALRARHSLLALPPALGLLLVGILWGTKSAPLGAWQGIAFALVAIGWAAGRKHRSARAAQVAVFDQAPRRSTPVRVSAGIAVLAVAAGVAAVATPHLLDRPRFVLRDEVAPPLDLNSYASPLTDYRYLERDLKKTPLLSVAGLPADQRLQLAVLDSYDGIVYNVSGSSAGFLRMGQRYDDGAKRLGTPETLHVSIDGYQGVWLPGGGQVSSVSFTDPKHGAEAAGLYYNPTTGDLLTTGAVAQHAAYDVVVTAGKQPTDAQLAADQVSAMPLGAVTGVPDSIGRLATDWTAHAKTPIDQLRALEQKLHTTGFYSDGSDGKSRAGHTAERLAAMVAAPQLIGDDEQYAVLMALMARSIGIPARVVMGFYPPKSGTSQGAPVTLTGSDAHVWVEVPFVGAGWARFDPTPDRSRTPQMQTTAPKPRPQPKVLPPPVPPKDMAQQPPVNSTQGQKKPTRQPTAGTDWAGVIRIVGYGVGGGILLLSPFLLVLGLKHRRRRRRIGRPRFADRISGAWDELTDRAVDLGATRVPGETRQERAARFAEQLNHPGIAHFAAEVDATVFGDREPDSAAAERIWDDLNRVGAELRAPLSRYRRARAALSLRSLAGRRPSTVRSSGLRERLSALAPRRTTTEELS